MKIDTQKIKEEIRKLVPTRDYTNSSVEVTYNPKNHSGSVTLMQEYDYVNFDFEFLEKLSKIFKTKKIDVGDRYAREGCPTCDHGSSYEITFTIREIGSIKE